MQIFKISQSFGDSSFTNLKSKDQVSKSKFQTFTKTRFIFFAISLCRAKHEQRFEYSSVILHIGYKRAPIQIPSHTANHRRLLASFRNKSAPRRSNWPHYLGNSFSFTRHISGVFQRNPLASRGLDSIVALYEKLRRKTRKVYGGQRPTRLRK